MCTLDGSFLRRIQNIEKEIKNQEKTINICLDLIEGIHVVIDNETGTNLVSTPPPHIRGRSRKKRKSHKKGKTHKKGKSRRGSTHRKR